MPVIDILANTSSGDARPAAAFVKGLGEAGFEDGKTSRSTTGGPTVSMIGCRRWQLISFAAKWPDRSVWHAGGTRGQGATTTIPIVFTTIADPVQSDSLPA